jgi:hypothetical protein
MTEDGPINIKKVILCPEVGSPFQLGNVWVVAVYQLWRSGLRTIFLLIQTSLNFEFNRVIYTDIGDRDRPLLNREKILE